MLYQDDHVHFVDNMQTKINQHVQNVHWAAVHHLMLPTLNKRIVIQKEPSSRRYIKQA